jgi:hypothetical protein
MVAPAALGNRNFKMRFQRQPILGILTTESQAALAAALTAVCERVIALAFALHRVVVLTALIHAYRVSLRAGIEARISLADLC